MSALLMLVLGDGHPQTWPNKFLKKAMFEKSKAPAFFNILLVNFSKISASFLTELKFNKGIGQGS